MELQRFINRGRKPPLPEGAIPGIRVDDGRLSNKFRHLRSKALNLQYSMETTGGNSGSPIVNACAEVIGLHYTGSRAKLKLDKSGTYAVGDTSKYNQAVASSEVIDFLSRAGVPFTNSNDRCQVGGG